MLDLARERAAGHGHGRTALELGLGGKQVEGRQAVRELLMAEKRKVYDIFISAELEGDAGVSDIVEIARAQRVPLSPSSEEE